MADEIYPLGENIFRETLFHNYVTIFTLTNMTRDTVDIWIAACNQLMSDAVQQDTSIFIIQDLSHPEVTQTPYSQARGQELVDAYPTLKGYIAYILQESADAQRIRLFVKRQNNHFRQREVFFSREDAFSWIEKILNQKKLINSL
jgi:hypothetical protein